MKKILNSLIPWGMIASMLAACIGFAGTATFASWAVIRITLEDLSPGSSWETAQLLLTWVIIAALFFWMWLRTLRKHRVI